MLFDYVTGVVIALLAILVVSVIAFFKWSFKYWERKQLEFLEPRFLFGTMENPFARTCSLGLLMKKYYDEFKKRGCKHGGLYNFWAPVYFPVDPEFIKNVMQRDFSHFVDRGAYYNEKDDPLSAHLFAIGGEKWQNLRIKLTPTFTSGKMKMMFHTLVQSGHQMKAAMDEYCDRKEAIDIKDIVARFTTDIIGSCAFGVECNSFKGTDAEFRKHGKNIFLPHSKFRAIRHMFANARPDIGRSLGIIVLPKISTDFFMNVIKEAVGFREKNNFIRNDMLQLLINIKNSKSKNPENEKQGVGNTLTTEELAAQALVFFLAGFETSSTTMSFCLFELARNPDMQDRLRVEINQILNNHNGEITYDSLLEMKYLGQVVEETLRKYPPLPVLHRRCVKKYKVPGTDLVVEKGTLTSFSILGLHRDPEYFPDPEKFDPERFSDENRKNIRPFTYLPFGEGPRICIGLRFGLMQTKLGLIVLLKNYKFRLNDKLEVPLTINSYTPTILTTSGPILLDFERVD